jgi:Spy/CpxP family protein refolding chaperone
VAPARRTSERFPANTRLVVAWQADVPSSGAKKSTSAPRATSKGGTNKPASSTARRLPRYYAQLELADEQKQQVLEIQQRFAEREDELRRQLSDLLAQRDQELKKVLTRAQQRKLNDLQEEATAKEPPAEPTGTATGVK